MQKIKKYHNIKLIFTLFSSTSTYVFVQKRNKEHRFHMDYYSKIIETGYTIYHTKRYYYTLQEYLWLLRWKKIVREWTCPTSIPPATLNLFTLIPDNPPALDKSEPTAEEKNVMEKLK